MCVRTRASRTGCVTGLWGRGVVGGAKETEPVAQQVGPHTSKGRTIPNLILPSTHQRFTRGLNWVASLAPCTHNLGSGTPPDVPAGEAGKARGKFARLSPPGASARKGRHTAAGGSWALGGSRRVSGHLGGLCLDLQAGTVLPGRSQGSSRGGSRFPSCLLLCFPQSRAWERCSLSSTPAEREPSLRDRAPGHGAWP